MKSHQAQDQEIQVSCVQTWKNLLLQQLNNEMKPKTINHLQEAQFTSKLSNESNQQFQLISQDLQNINEAVDSDISESKLTIEFLQAETSNYLIEEIEEFINRMQLTTEQQILKQIYPDFFIQCIKEKFIQQIQSYNQEPVRQKLDFNLNIQENSPKQLKNNDFYTDHSPIKENQINENNKKSSVEANQINLAQNQDLNDLLFEKIREKILQNYQLDQKCITYIPIRKEKFLQDIKQFIYNYCCTGMLYPNHQKFKRVQQKQDVFISKLSKENLNYQEFYEDKEIQSKKNQLFEDQIIYGELELKKQCRLKILKIIYVIKEMVQQQLKQVQTYRMNRQKEGQIIQNTKIGYNVLNKGRISMPHEKSQRQKTRSTENSNDINCQSSTKKTFLNFSGQFRKSNNVQNAFRSTYKPNAFGSFQSGLRNSINKQFALQTQRISQITSRQKSSNESNNDEAKQQVREQDIDSLDIQVQKGKLLIKHLLSKLDSLQENNDQCPSKDYENFDDSQQYKEILFNLLITKNDFQMIDTMNDFVDLIQQNFLKLIDIDDKNELKQKCMNMKSKSQVTDYTKYQSKYELIFIEQIEEQQKLLIHCKEKCSMDLEGKEVIVFLIQQAQVYKKEIDGVQTRSLPQYEYQFNPSKPKSMGQSRYFFYSQRMNEGQDQNGYLTFSECVCSICQKLVSITDEFIRILDCNHIYHRICLIHFIAQLTNKRFFLTKKERKKDFDDQNIIFSLCQNCKLEDPQIGYLSQKIVNKQRKHIIFDLLKDKADIFYTKMLERKVLEEKSLRPMSELYEICEGNKKSNQSDIDSEDYQNINEIFKVKPKCFDDQDQDIHQDYEQNKQDEQQIYQIQWKNNNQLKGNFECEKDNEDFDYLSESIRNTLRNKNELSICDDREEIDTIYTELDKSLAIKKKQIIALANKQCSVCLLKSESCIVLSKQCLHYACVNCIQKKITEPIQDKLDQREKISVDLVLCKSDDWCQNIIPLDILLPLLNLSVRDHQQEIERIKDLYEDSVCCKGQGQYQFIDQQKWMAHCIPCGGKYCVVCLNGDDAGVNFRQTSRPTLAQCQCVRCPQCDSANTVNREETKSYYCHICTKNFCWRCHKQLDLCKCYQNPILESDPSMPINEPKIYKKNNQGKKKKNQYKN